MKRTSAAFALAVLAGCSRSAIPAGVTEDIRIPRPIDHTVQDMQEGESGCAWILFTNDGIPIVGKSQPIHDCPSRDRIWLQNGKLLGKLRQPPDAYSYINSLSMPDGYLRVWLVERP